MNRTKEKLDSDKHIMIAGFISVFFSVCTSAPDIPGLILCVGLPLYCSISFMLTKYPFFGFVCAFMFLYNRNAAFSNRGTLLAAILILAITAYFAYAAYKSLKDWGIRNEQKGIISRSKNMYCWLAFLPWILIFIYCFFMYQIDYSIGNVRAFVIGAMILKWGILIMNFLLAVAFICKMCKMQHLSLAKKVLWGISMVLFAFLVFPLFWMVHLHREPRQNTSEIE